jgi:membrane protein DedA with SNARE-associated domain
MLEMAAIINVDALIEAAGYPLLLLLVMAESGGVPVPGETALIAGAVFASQGKLALPAVIAIAAVAAIVGDNIGYVIGRRGGRWLLQKPGPFHRHRLKVLATGATKMRWRVFALWNALGGICWACVIGIAAYYVGRSAENAVSAFGIYGLVAVAIAAAGVLLARYRRRRSRQDDLRRSPEPSVQGRKMAAEQCVDRETAPPTRVP